ncbi:calcium channel protein BcCCH1 [Coleophoma crateriformis]|uniref:Calcium-channel protein CCH1 n=1 Tax=Coleophoma crateriformis TaxID=565419 RepID=A0A3D8T703_9HELO|nr:calcium channel protein BcCCH1 [Coleophoma crateriformis]
MPPANSQDAGQPSTPPQSIPLRDLQHPPDSTDLADGERWNMRGRGLLSGSRPTSGHNDGPRYERLGDTSPSPGTRGNPRAVVATTSHQQPSVADEEMPLSPGDNPADFQSALGFAGLNVPDISFSQAPPTRKLSYDSGEFDRVSPYSSPYHSNFEDSQSYFPGDSDTLPLTNHEHLQPISGARATTPDGQNHDRISFQSVQFTPESRTRGTRLGDDLHNAEAGLSPSAGRNRAYSLGTSLSPDGRSRSRSPSTVGALSRAGSVMRAMSQRVVNLSGDAELLEQHARQQANAEIETAQPRASINPMNGDETYRNEGWPVPFEKAPPNFSTSEPPSASWQQEPQNPLRGKTLGIFAPDNKLRRKLCDILVYPVTEPFILILIVLQTVLLAVEAAPNVYTDPRPKSWGHSPIDWTILALFVVFTLEILARMVVSGFIFNPPEYSTIDRERGLKGALVDKYRAVFAPERKSSLRVPRTTLYEAPTIIRSFTTMQGPEVLTVEQAQRQQLARRAFLRHSFNRLDFVAVVSFWAAYLIGLFGVESENHLYVFRMLSCLRILRLLALTNGTAIILRSLKKATPLLLNVSFLIGFFWLLFAIVGVQSFKSSLSRQCVWLDPLDTTNMTAAYVNSLQFCGGYLNNDTGAKLPWVQGDLANLKPGADNHKGFLCPRGSICLEVGPEYRPYNGTVNFDNILQSLELVFVIMSSNTYSDLMYYTTNSDYLAAALFFAAGIVIMMLWLMNLLIAVITSSFQVIREEGKASAFAANKDLPVPEDTTDPRRVSGLKRLFDKTSWIWVIIIAFDLLCQALRSASMTRAREELINNVETVVTFVLLFEIIVRFAVDWRGFHRSWINWFDLALAIITTIIQLPQIHSSGNAYAWLTVFQILRIYRVVIAVSITRSLIMLVLGNAKGIANLVLFVFLMTFLMSIFAVQLFRGELPQADDGGNTIEVTFFTIYNAFLGMYQVLSSENWTTIMYNITSFDNARNTGWIGAVFFIGWFIFGNFILVNMFIAVIQENFDVSEDEKRMQQVKAFLNRKEAVQGSSNLSLSSIFRLGRTGGKKDPLDYGPATMEMLLKDAVVKDFLDDEGPESIPHGPTPPSPPVEPSVEERGFISSMKRKFITRIWHREPNPFYSYGMAFSRTDDHTDARTMAKDAVSATTQRKRLQREFLARHPNYNNSLFLFKPSNPLRRLCQKIVGPGRGSERFDGVEPNRVVWYIFSAFVYAAIVAMVLLACVTTPLYQKEYFQTHTFAVANWFVWADTAFAILFTVEALIKVIADGFFWTPNAYFRSLWGFIDGIVLVTLWINVVTSFRNDGAISRAVGAFKALRALRLLNVSDSAKETFNSVILVGGWKVLSAAFVSLSLLIPFAIYGVNLFSGKMQLCNDSSNITNLTACFGEYSSTPFSSDWPLLAPRAVSNPYYDFDNFGGALFILFQIVSQEGWVDVMWSAQSITGPGLQPQDFASQGNAIFFVIFNLLATVFVLTLFISVFMRNYTEQTGVAYLTADQRSWLELRKLLRQVSPSKRPSSEHGNKFKAWCYKRATRKHGTWHRATTIILVLHLIILLLEYDSEPTWLVNTRDYVFLAFTVFYIANVFVRINGLSWARFRRSSWDVFSIFAVAGTFATTILLLTNFTSQTYIQLHKLFLVSIVLLLIPRNDALDQLFKTAAASLSNIGNLLATWFALYLVFAIAMTQTFGLTRFGSNEDGNVNFRTVPKALILLFRMSTGEGWNTVMEDFATIAPPLCTPSNTFFDSDCGSAPWARALFISWNILSMYLFTNLFVSLIYESFSYVYQHSSGLGKISREEIRRFKQAWATHDPDGTGYISKEVFPRLLGELSGVFEMRIYSHENSVRSILEDVQSRPSSISAPSIASTSAATGIDLKKLNARLAKIKPLAVQRARARYNLFFQEVMVSADPDHGISFTSVLMILAHYNIISDNKSLRLEEFLRRRARLQRVEEEVRRRIVVGFFDTMYWSRKFRKHVEKKKSGRMTTIPQLGPEVFIDEDEGVSNNRKQSSAMLSPVEAENSRNSFIAYGLDGPKGRARRGTEVSINVGQLSPQLSPQRATASGFNLEASGDTGSAANSAHSSRRGSAVSAENVLEVLDNSAWGESIRRSFTMRRPSKADHGA